MPPLVWLVEGEGADKLISDLLHCGYRARHFPTAAALEHAMAAPQVERPDVLLVAMDIDEGEEVSLCLAQMPGLGNVPVLMLGCRTDLSAHLTALRAGARRYLARPLDNNRILELLDSLTGRRPAAPYRVLLVDDEPHLLAAHASILESAGMHVQPLSNPINTIAMVEAFHPEVLVLDVHMPLLSGMELASILREREDCRHLPIIFLSAEREVERQLTAMALGSDDFLLKPVHPDHLAAVVGARAHRSRDYLTSELGLRNQRDLHGLLTSLAGILLDASALQIDAAIETALAESGRHLQADRSYLFMVSENGSRVTNTHEWCADGVESTKGSEQGELVASMSWWWDRMSTHKHVLITDVDSLPPEARAERELLQSQSVKSLFAMPLRRLDKITGFIGFDAVRHRRTWRLADVELIGVLGNLIGSAIARRDVETELRRSARHLTEAQDLAKLGDWNLDVRTGEAHWSDAVYRAFGLEPGRATPSLEQQRHLFAPESWDRLKAMLERSEQEGAFELELEIVPRDGKRGWIWVRGERVEDGKGNLVGLHGVAQDISIRKHIESELERRGHFQSMVASIAADLISVGRNTLHDRLDESLARIGAFFGVDRCDLFLFDPGLDNVSNTNEWCRPGVTPKSQALQSFPVDQAPWYRRLIVDERAVVHVPDVDDLPDAAIAEQALMHAFGIRSALSVPVQMRDRLYGFVGFDAVQQRTTWSENDIDGLRVIAQIIASALDRVEADRTLLQLKEKAEAANLAKSQFLARMSHELRTPMNAVLGFSQLLASDPDVTDDQKDGLQEIARAGQHLLDLINEILDLAKIEAGKMTVTMEPVDVSDLVATCLTLTAPMAAKQHVQVRSELGSAVWVKGDRTRLRQSLLNLLSNAIKYNRTGGHVTVRVERLGGDWVHVCVEDTGHGIASELLDELFQPFNRLAAERGPIEGTGIGLAITHALVEMMRGRLSVESTIGEGSRFCMELCAVQPVAATVAEGNPRPSTPETSILSTIPAPLPHSTSMPVVMPVVPAATAAPAPPNQYVLYIEDNPVNMRLVKQILGKMPGISLLAATSPVEGIDLARRRHPDLILLDINMPGMDGYEVLEVLKADPRAVLIPTVAVTANAMPRDIERGRQAGFADYITKPLDIAVFKQTVSFWLRRAKKSTS